MTWRRIGMLGATTALAASALAVAQGVSQGASEGASAPRPGERGLLAVSAVGPDDVWAVGYTKVAKQVTPLVEHWDGTSWSEVATPDLGSRARLKSVSALAADDVWAVGTSNLSTGPDRHSYGKTLIEHWDGTAWERVPSPNPSEDQNQLMAVHAISANDVWAAGFRYPDDESPRITLTEHWNGTAWTWVQSGLSPQHRLLDIDATSKRDVWVVGKDPTAWIQRWNGSGFTEQPIDARTALTGVAALSPKDTWVVGRDQTIHWDGTTWTSVANAGIDDLQGISAASANDIWAVGGPSIEHWDGTSWQQSQTADVGTLWGVEAISATDAWAVGSVDGEPLIEHWDGENWVVVPAA